MKPYKPYSIMNIIDHIQHCYNYGTILLLVVVYICESDQHIHMYIYEKFI